MIDIPQPVPKDQLEMDNLHQLFVDSTGGVVCRAKFSNEKQNIWKIVSLIAGDTDVLNLISTSTKSTVKLEINFLSCVLNPEL